MLVVCEGGSVFWQVLDLADVSRGGLGSFSLANMIIAHLQEEDKVHTP